MQNRSNTKIVTIAIFLTTFMTAIEGTIVSTAMPTIVSDLNGLEIMNWVVSTFLLMTAVSTPIYGKLADSIGRKPVIAPLLGGFIVQHLSWHWIFYINVPLGIIAFLLVVFFLKERKTSSNSTLDLKGTTCLVIFLLALMVFLQELENGLTIVLLGLVVIIIVSAIIFFKAEKRAKDPIMPLDMLSSKEFTMINLITLLISGVVIGFEFYIPTWMQGINATSASIAGFAVTPSSLMWIVGSFLIGGMLGRWGIKKTYDYMLLILIVADLALILVPIYTSFWIFCLIAAFNGTAFGAITTASQVRSQVLVGHDKIGVATSFNTLMKYLGQTMMVSIYGITFNVVVAKQLSHHPNLTQKMMNDIVSADKAKHLAANLIPSLRQVLLSGLKSVYVVSLIVIVLSLILNQLYKQKKIAK
ncbi:MFS transporter [Lactobacillus gasseri]|uniref:MFS transporter n=1 Tax=Lactobacillus gasseri TaxID=1596 RepID=UPI0033143927